MYLNAHCRAISMSDLDSWDSVDAKNGLTHLDLTPDTRDTKCVFQVHIACLEKVWFKIFISRIILVSYFAMRSVNRIIKITFLINFDWMASISEGLVISGAIITTVLSILGTTRTQCSPLSLVEECRGSALIGREMMLRQLSYAIRDRWLPCTERSYYRRPYAIKNQRGASKIPPKALDGLWMRQAGSLWHKRAG